VGVDRDAQEVCGLDEDLVLAHSVRLGWPLAVRSRRMEARGSCGRASGTPRVLPARSNPGDGSIAVEIEVGRCKVLALRDSGEALVVEQARGAKAQTVSMCWTTEARVKSSGGGRPVVA